MMKNNYHTTPLREMRMFNCEELIQSKVCAKLVFVTVNIFLGIIISREYSTFQPSAVGTHARFELSNHVR